MHLSSTLPPTWTQKSTPAPVSASANRSSATDFSHIPSNIILSPLETEWFVFSKGYQARLTAQLLHPDHLCTDSNWSFNNTPISNGNYQTRIGKELSLIVMLVDATNIGEYSYTCRGYTVKTQLQYPGNIIIL
jgi:hypothetical protein